MTRKKQITTTVARRLVKGDTVGIAAPAGPFKREVFKRGIGVLAELGYRVYIPNGLFTQEAYLAGNDRHRAELLNALFADPAIKGIWCARGGFGSMRLLPYLDYGIIQQNPKILIGFSDVTALLVHLYTHCGLVTFHGPLVTSLADSTKKSLAALRHALSSEECILLTATGRQAVLKPGKAAGPVIGGNLTTLCHLLKTPFEPNLAGHILFLEDTDEASYRIDRMLSQMKMAGCFDELAGIALGSFRHCGAAEAIRRIFKEMFSDLPIPILQGFQFGHVRTNLTLPVGLNAVLDTDEGTLRYKVPATKEAIE